MFGPNSTRMRSMSCFYGHHQFHTIFLSYKPVSGIAGIVQKRTDNGQWSRFTDCSYFCGLPAFDFNLPSRLLQQIIQCVQFGEKLPVILAEPRGFQFFLPSAEILFFPDNKAFEIDFFPSIDFILDDRTDLFNCGPKPYLLVESHKCNRDWRMGL